MNDTLPFAIAMIASGLGTTVASAAWMLSRRAIRGLAGVAVGLLTAGLGALFVAFRNFGDNPSSLSEYPEDVAMLAAWIAIGPLIALSLWRQSARSLVLWMLAFATLTVLSFK